LGKIGKTLFGGSSEGPVLGNNEENQIREAIYQDFKKIIVACLHCWNDLPIFTTRDFNFSRSGIFPFSSEDDKLVNQMIEKFNKEQNSFNNSTLPNDSRGTVTRDTTISTMVPITQ
jgi:hypothetical protein